MCEAVDLIELDCVQSLVNEMLYLSSWDLFHYSEIKFISICCLFLDLQSLFEVFNYVNA